MPRMKAVEALDLGACKRSRKLSASRRRQRLPLRVAEPRGMAVGSRSTANVASRATLGLQHRSPSSAPPPLAPLQRHGLRWNQAGGS